MPPRRRRFALIVLILSVAIAMALFAWHDPLRPAAGAIAPDGGWTATPQHPRNPR